MFLLESRGMDLSLMETKSTYKKDRRIEDKFSKTLKSILGNVFIGNDINKDLNEGTDFLTFTVKPFTVGVRLRRYKYYKKYKDEFTLRWSRPSGVKTEIHKVREGLVDYILYGFLSEKEDKIISYFVGSFNIFKEHEIKPVCIKPNYPICDSTLAVYKINQFPEDFIVHRYH